MLASDRAPALGGRARGATRRLREAAERCEDVRQALELNVSEDLALSALGPAAGGACGRSRVAARAASSVSGQDTKYSSRTICPSRKVTSWWYISVSKSMPLPLPRPK